MLYSTVYAQGNTAANDIKLSSLSERFEIGEELIVTIRVGEFNYGEVFAVVTETGLFINPEELISILDFPINRFSSEEEYLLKGWFIAENKSFEMRLFNTVNENGVGEVIIIGEQAYIASDQYMEFAGDRLINFDLVGSWFGLSLSFDRERLSINAVASMPLPAQSKLKREKQRVNDRRHLIPEYPNFDFGYFARSHQMFDASVNAQYVNDTLSGYYSLVGIQDIAGFSTRFFARGTNNDLLQTSNINFLKQSINSDLLGPLAATTLEFGDIRPTRVAGVTGGESIGISVNNQKLGQAYDFEFTNITGVIQEGWDVELYQNGVLTRKQLNTQGGQYEFLDVPLFGQLNTFDIVKYGPQGQIEKERVERNLDDQTFSKRAQYNVSLTRSNTSLLNDDNASGEEQDLFLSGTYQYSPLSWVSTRFSHNLNLSDSESFYSIGATARVSPRLLANTSYSYTDEERQSFSVSLQSQLFGQYLNVAANRNFLANNNYSDNLSLRMSGNIFQANFGRMSYRNDYSANRQKNGNYEQNIGNVLTFSSRLGFLSHSFNKRLKRIDGLREDFSFGGLTLGVSAGKLNARLNANYELEQEVNTINWLGADASINYEFNNDFSTQLRVSRAFENKFDTYGFSVQWSQPSYMLFGSLTHNSNNDTAVSLNARFSMSEAPFGKGYVASGRALTSNALVAVRLYEDINQNFVFDEEDRPLPNVRVKAAQLTRNAESGEDGVAILEGIGTFRQTDLSVDLDTLDDPYLLQSTVNTSLTPRGGLLTLVNYPFVQGIEFEGELNASSHHDGTIDKMNNATIEIYRSNGELAKTVRTEFDGYFYSGVLFPDKYTLKVSEDYLNQNRLLLNQVTTVNASKAGSFVPDIQINAIKLPYVESYQPYVGVFSDEKLAKGYIRMFQARYKFTSFAGQVTLHFANEDKKFYVGFNPYETEQQARKFCEINRQLLPKCKVKKDKYKTSASSSENFDGTIGIGG